RASRDLAWPPIGRLEAEVASVPHSHSRSLFRVRLFPPSFSAQSAHVMNAQPLPSSSPPGKPWQGQDSKHVLEILCSLVPALVAAGEREGSGCAPLAQDPSRRRPVG